MRAGEGWLPDTPLLLLPVAPPSRAQPAEDENLMPAPCPEPAGGARGPPGARQARGATQGRRDRVLGMLPTPGDCPLPQPASHTVPGSVVVQILPGKDTSSGSARAWAAVGSGKCAREGPGSVSHSAGTVDGRSRELRPEKLTDMTPGKGCRRPRCGPGKAHSGAARCPGRRTRSKNHRHHAGLSRYIAVSGSPLKTAH